MKRAGRGQLVNRGKTVFLRFSPRLGLKRGVGSHKNKKSRHQIYDKAFFHGAGRARGRKQGVRGGQIWRAGTHVCLICLGPFLWEKSEEVTMHSEMGAAQFGPTVTRVSNLSYESDEKSTDEREGRAAGVWGGAGGL